jgi:PAS domain S-box-containing protein
MTEATGRETQLDDGCSPTPTQKAIFAVLLGFLGFPLNFLPLQLEIPPHHVSVLFGAIYPLLAALAWGPWYGLLAGTAGLGGQFCWFVWPENGWANVMVAAFATAWFAWHGYCARRRAETPSWRWSLYVAEFAFRAVYVLGLYTLYRWLFAWNPAPWAPQSNTVMPVSVVHIIALKAVVNHYLIVFACDVLLSLPFLRRILGMPVHPSWRHNTQILSAACLLGVAMWVLGAGMDFLRADPPRQTFVRHLVQNPTGGLAIVIAWLMAGLLASRQFIRRLQADASVREIEEKYRAVVDATLTGFVMLDEQGRVLDANPEYVRLTGRQALRDILGRCVVEWLAPHEQDRHAPGEMRRRLAQGPITGLEIDFQDPAGRIIPVEINATALRRGSGLRILALCRDIGERRRAAEALSRYQLLAGQARDIVLFVRQDGRILEANRAAEEAYGYSREELLSLSINDLRAADTRDAIAPQMRRAASDGILFETAHRRKDGSTFPVEVNSRGANVNGEQVLLSIVRDISKRKRAEQALAERTRQLEGIRTVSEEITRELDLDALLTLITQRATELVGATSGGIYLWDERAALLVPRAYHGPSRLRERFPRRPGEGLMGRIAQERRGMLVNDYRTSPFAHPRTIETTRITAVLAEPFLYRERFLGVIAVHHEEAARTFTAQDQEVLALFAVQAAIAIENARLFTELEQSFRNLQRAQDELVRSEKLRALGQMAAGIAHDLNNTLAAILGQVELLRLRTAVPEIREGLELLGTAATDGASVVRRLQDFARQRSESPLTPVDLAAIVREAVEITRPRWKDEMQQRGQTIHVQLAFPDLPRVLGHAAEIREALTNLILNAVDAMPHGGTITLGAGVRGRETADRDKASFAFPPPRTPCPPAWVDLTVADTGVGMPEEVRRHACEPFFTTKGPRGTGLGLSVVYGIMERHGGRIDLASRPGQGTTVTLSFQATESTTEAPPPRPAPLPSVKRLLLIDDDSMVRESIADILRTVGHIVFEAEGGPAGLAILETHPVDLVLTDLGMSEMTGWEVARRIKARSPDLPVVLLTGWGPQAVLAPEARSLVRAMLGKPVTLEDLLRAIGDATTPARS